MTPAVSVVMPVRNGLPFVSTAVESILGQTIRELELIVVDDGSTDGTSEYLDTVAADSRVRVLRQEQAGVSAALVRGCAEARGDLIARMDADDIALPDRLERQLALLRARPAVALVGGAYVVIDRAERRGATVRFPTGDEALRRRLKDVNPFAHPTVVFRRQAYEEVGGYRLDEFEDYDLWLRISERHELATIAEPVLLYRHHAGQASAARVERQVLTGIAIREAAKRRSVGAPDPLDGVARVTVELVLGLGVSQKRIDRGVADHHLHWAVELATAGEDDAAQRLLEGARAHGVDLSRRGLAALVALGRAKAALRERRRLAAAAEIVRALASDPRVVTARLRRAASGWRAG